PQRDNRILFAQREAVETAIFLAEVSGRRAGFRDWRPELDDQNAEHNEGLPRVALKMATGTGKTVVMAMLIAWQTLNKVVRPSDARFAKRFLVVAPGITIRDRLRVLQPNDPGNYYDARGIVPADLRGLLGKAQILVVNYHAFLLRDRKEIRGVASMTRKILLGGATEDPFKETEADMVSRVLRGWGVGTGRQPGEIVVLNDEAHHCYMDKPITLASQMQGVEEGDKSEKKEIERRNEDARVWFKGLRAISEKVGIKTVYDLSATPFYLSGSGYKDGFIFPWTVSDFSLMDAIECGIVKVPRVPVDDNSAGDVVTFRNLWSAVEKKLPKRGRANTALAETPVLPVELEAALHSLYRSYTTAFEYWEKELAPLEEPPPVFIVVCPNTATSKLIYDWIAGREIARENDTPLRIPGSLELFSNIVADRALGRPRTILIDSAQLESGEALSADFKAAAATEIETFKADSRLRNPGADVNALTGEDLLREVMNTVGKKGQLGAEVRCVVSVSMLTEGWDANTVTHILGVRAFRSQLLCEQVVGRGLRRRSYAVNEYGRFDAEYANVYGVPFAFIPTDKPVGPPKPPTPAVAVHTVPGREHLRITFPHVEGYRLEIPDEELYLPDDLPPFVIGKGQAVPTWTEVAPAVGEPELVTDEAVTVRPRTVAYRLARRLVQTHFALGEDIGDGGVKAEPRPWLFPALLRVSTEWVDRGVNVEAGFSLGYLAKYATWEAAAADALYAAINMQQGERRARIRPILRRYDPVGSTGNVSFPTRKATLIAQPDRSEISHVVLDGVGGNTWEQLAKEYCEHSPQVYSYAKNDHLGFSIPYVHEGRTHDYVPDFLVRLRRRDDVVERTLVVEISGSQKGAFTPGLPELKATTARDSWCAAVNNHGGFGRWGYVEVNNPLHLAADLDAAIEALYADQPIIGDPDLLDLPRS
ncbi:BPTD_3080 family restriction endonuclease, partial [Piscicoccus intestinalis]|uniref:BPTD_3080 family restriction endonuclease n=1 Tax=Piscicoccus intestinalis TaxID=746033 RepID=UPI000838FCAA